ncbi:hypothetical protein QVD99_008530 [Batrachochytrium dendrobatidis]|nr:hypothetical protein O5D80_007399 [Batrachochytrium dendrobatidis]KAK5664995.1 hypothetical protein QVD99_008530 [Batrachochytrium dendrobatidis]
MLHFYRPVQSALHAIKRRAVCIPPIRSFSEKSASSIIASKSEHPLAILHRLHPSYCRSGTVHRKWMDVFREKIRTTSTVSVANPTGSDVKPIAKRPFDSYVEVFLRFSSDPKALEEYISTYKTIRIGKVLEDLDALAAAISFLHVDSFEPESPTVVTASVDRIDIIRRIPTTMDVKMSGFVTYVGNSSLEVSITMETCPDQAPPPGTEGFGYDAAMAPKHASSERILTAKFIMVALDPKTFKPCKVPQLLLETQQDRHLFMMGAEHKLSKKKEDDIALNKVPPKVDEMLLIHDLHREHLKYSGPDATATLPENIVWMKDAVQESLTVCMPQDRNLHQKIFGGYLMRLAFELAYANSLIFVKSPIQFVALDNIIFRLPVNIGSLLSLRSQVVYSSGAPSKNFQVMVIADVLDPLYRNGRLNSNTFHFTFSAPYCENVPRVIPQTYEESMKYIEGRRHKQQWEDHQQKF